MPAGPTAAAAAVLNPKNRKVVWAAVATAFALAVALLVFGGPSAPSARVGEEIDIAFSPAGAGCEEPGDCLSHVCRDGVCAAASCRDGVVNGDESDVDCGGYCRLCDHGARCTVADDCVSGMCSRPEGSAAPTVCVRPTCTDGVQNGHETDTDCGGEACPPCANGKDCTSEADCLSKLCSKYRCVHPSCQDGEKNAQETDVDCGGPHCLSCEAGKSCTNMEDCNSFVCTDGACVGATCDDGEGNGEETSRDCGGPVCNPCEDFEMCLESRDCVSKSCQMDGDSGMCMAPTCSDGVQNGEETDVDCGSPQCLSCKVNQKCSVADDCSSGVCKDGKCGEASCTDGVRNGREADVDCGAACGDDKLCADGKICLFGDEDCQSANCDDEDLLCLPAETGSQTASSAQGDDDTAAASGSGGGSAAAAGGSGSGSGTDGSI